MEGEGGGVKLESGSERGVSDVSGEGYKIFAETSTIIALKRNNWEVPLSCLLNASM